MSRDPVLQVESLVTQLTTAAGTVNVVDGVSFDLAAGESLGVVGESGSGKSMTALSLLRVLPKPVAKTVSGRAVLNGVDLLAISERRMRKVRGRDIGMILQDPHTSLNPVFTVGNQLRESLRLHDPRASRATLFDKAVESLRSVRIADPEHRINSYPHQMSGGMKQRVVGAIALAGMPSVLIADEPTTALDVTVQLQYLKLLQELQETSNVGIIFITHDFGIVARVCQRVMVMYAGRTVEIGPTRDVFYHPSHPYTEALLASVPSVEKKAQRLYAIRGQPATPSQGMRGCAFAPRCPHVHDRCLSEAPPKFAGKSGSGLGLHSAACWLLESGSTS